MTEIYLWSLVVVVGGDGGDGGGGGRLVLRMNTNPPPSPCGPCVGIVCCVRTEDISSSPPDYSPCVCCVWSR